MENSPQIRLNGDAKQVLKGAKTFSKVYRDTSLSVHFISTSDYGARMLKFMQIANYRDTIAKASLCNKYKPRYEGLYYTDTIHPLEPYHPVIMTVDLDIKRIDRALEDSRERGFGPIAIYVPAEQGGIYFFWENDRA